MVGWRSPLWYLGSLLTWANFKIFSNHGQFKAISSNLRQVKSYLSMAKQLDIFTSIEHRVIRRCSYYSIVLFYMNDMYFIFDIIFDIIYFDIIYLILCYPQGPSINLIFNGIFTENAGTIMKKNLKNNGHHSLLCSNRHNQPSSEC